MTWTLTLASVRNAEGPDKCPSPGDRDLFGGLVITPQTNIIGEENTGRVDYAIKRIICEMLEEIICITEGKQNQATIGVCQNLVQCRSACDVGVTFFVTVNRSSVGLTNLLHERLDSDPDYDYVYGIVSTGTDWIFILHSAEGIYSTIRTEYRISLTEDALEDQTELRKNVKRVLEVIVGLLNDRVSVCDEPATKKRRVEEKNKRK